MMKNQQQQLEDELTQVHKLVEDQRKKIYGLEKTVASKLTTMIELKDEIKRLQLKCEQAEAEQKRQYRQLQETHQHHDRRLGDVERNVLVETHSSQGRNKHRYFHLNFSWQCQENFRAVCPHSCPFSVQLE